MKRADERTEYVLLRTHTDSNRDECDYALIHMPLRSIITMVERLETLRQILSSQSSLYSLEWSGMPGRFYLNAKHESDPTKEILKIHEAWAFVTLDDQEKESLTVLEERLGTPHFVLDKNEEARFVVYNDVGDKFYTGDFFLEELIDIDVTMIKLQEQNVKT